MVEPDDEVHAETPSAASTPYGDGKTYTIDLRRSDEEKARDGYERMRAHLRSVGDTSHPPWEALGGFSARHTSKATWIAKARNVEKDRESWFTSGSVALIAFAKGVLQLE